METFEIQILSFIHPHLFYVATDLQHRKAFLKDVSSRIKKSNPKLIKNTTDCNQVVGVVYNSDIVRAKVISIECETTTETFYCFLIDHGIINKTEKIYELPAEIQEIPPRSRQASLKDICYVTEHLELGVTGQVKQEQTRFPSLITTQKALDLLLDHDKLLFEVAERFKDILIGEVLILKGNKKTRLTEELCKHGSLTINKDLFETLKCDMANYIKTHLKNICQIASLQIGLWPSVSEGSVPFLDLSYCSDLDDIDVDNIAPLENGRHRRLLYASKAMSETSSESESTAPMKQSRKAQVQKMLEIINKKRNEQPQQALLQKSKHSTSEIVKMITERRLKKCSTSSSASSTKAEESGRQITDKNIFCPAGMERVSPTAKQCHKRRINSQNDSISINSLEKLDKNSTTNMEEPNVDNKAASEQAESSISSSNETFEKSSSEAPNKPLSKEILCRMMTGCSCAKCRLHLEEENWDTTLNFASEEPTPTAPKTNEPVIKPPKLLKDDDKEQTNEANDILSIDYASMTAIEKKMSAKVLVHGESIPVPIKQLSQANMHYNIYRNLSKVNYKEFKRIQRYAVPSITRSQHVFMVSDAKSGKTLAYLPILISFVAEKQERYARLLKAGGGPIVVILCSNSKKCYEIYKLSKMICDQQKIKCWLATYPGHGNVSNIDILITMPTVLSALILSRAVNFKRLCHFVLEDADAILKNYNNLIMKFLNYTDKVLAQRNCPKAVQLILCSQHWTTEIENILLKLKKIPTVCVGNYLEAALYGKVKMTIKFLDTALKENTLCRILSANYKFCKSIVLCKTDEMDEVGTILTLKGIEYLSFATVTKEEDIIYLERAWHCAMAGNYSVLLCDDDIYNTIDITSANLLIHYSLPDSWTQFSKRFSSFLENFQSPLDSNKKKLELNSYVFIDETCETRMAKFSNFIKISGLGKDLPDNVKTYFESIVIDEEQKKIEMKTELCSNLKLFSRCPDVPRCTMRHVLSAQSVKSDHLPVNGSIRFRILKTIEVSCYSIKLLEHYDPKGQRTREFPDRTDEIKELIAASEKRPVRKLNVGHLYLHMVNEDCLRCRLFSNDDYPLVYLIDSGIYSKSSLNNLYKMPERLKTIPPQSYEVYLANLIPPFEDKSFSPLANWKAQNLLDDNCPDAIMNGTIRLQLGDNLWLDDVYEYREMFDKTLPNIGIQLNRELVKMKLAVKTNEQLEGLYKLCNEAGIELPDYTVARPVVKKTSIPQVEPTWAFLDPESLHEVTFTSATTPHEFYVRQNKFRKQLQELEQDIQQQIKKPFYPIPKKIEVGKCYLVKEPATGNYARAMVVADADDGDIEVVCVDYGDTLFVAPTALKHISNECIRKLPFQSIQCSLYGIEPLTDEWENASVDLLYKMAFEGDSPVYRKLFLKVCSKQPNCYIAKQQSYSVLLKDGQNKQVLINELQIDCGYAKSSGENLEDFQLPNITTNIDDDEDESIEEIVRNDINDNEEVAGSANQLIDFSNFDCEIFDVHEFTNNFPQFIKNQLTKAVEEVTEKEQTVPELPAIKAVPPVDYLTPTVLWSQTAKEIALTIRVSDVKEARMTIRHNRTFVFSTIVNEKKYLLNLLLFDKVETAFRSCIFGSHVKINLEKREAGDWCRLLYKQGKALNIHYDVSALGEEDESQRPILTLDISDSSSNEEIIYDVSDLDSEYDYDIPCDNY